MTNLAKIKRLYLWKPSICKTFWTTLVQPSTLTNFKMAYLHGFILTQMKTY